MKKLIILLVLLLVCIVSADVTNQTVSNIIVVIDAIKENGFVLVLKQNWYLLLAVLVGIGWFIIKSTPSSKDDAWYIKYIINPFKFIGRIFKKR